MWYKDDRDEAYRIWTRETMIPVHLTPIYHYIYIYMYFVGQERTFWLTLDQHNVPSDFSFISKCFFNFKLYFGFGLILKLKSWFRNIDNIHENTMCFHIQ